MPRLRAITWHDLADRQAGLVARRQLVRLGYDDQYVDGNVRARRWCLVTDVVVATTTGPLSREQLMWAGVLHAGPGSAIGGLTALERRGLAHWHRDEICVLLAKSHNLQRLDGVRFVETRRPVLPLSTGALPTWRVEPAALLHAAYRPSLRAAEGLLAAVVQQRLTTADRLLVELEKMRPLRRARTFRATLTTIGGGSQSLAEIDLLRFCRRHGFRLPDRQTVRVDPAGRRRYTDAEWHFSDGTVVILEIDGSFHLEAHHWVADIARERDLVTTGAVVLRCAAAELRRGADDRLATSLRAAGVDRSSA